MASMPALTTTWYVEVYVLTTVLIDSVGEAVLFERTSCAGENARRPWPTEAWYVILFEQGLFPEYAALAELEARVRDRTRLLIESEGQLRLKVAEEQHMRKQQEIVVDLTSHELRNPLNATWQNAEMVEEALDRLRPVVPPEGLVALDEAQDAIESVRARRSVHHRPLTSLLRLDCAQRCAPDSHRRRCRSLGIHLVDCNTDWTYYRSSISRRSACSY